MKFKILLALIFVNLMHAQKFYFSKTAVADSAILEKQIPELVLQVIMQHQSPKNKPQYAIPFLDNLFRLQLAAKDNSLHSFLNLIKRNRFR